MTSYEFDVVTKLIASLFPKSTWTPEMHKLFRDRVEKYHVDTVTAVRIIEDHRVAASGRRTPNLGALVQKFHEAAYAKPVTTSYAAAEPERAPRMFVRDDPHPGVLTRDKQGRDVVVTWEEYAAANKIGRIDPKPFVPKARST